METAKRKAMDGSPDGDGKRKKARADNDGSGSLTLQSKADKVQGCDDDEMVGLFGSLSSAIETLALDQFKGYPYRTPISKQHKEFFEGLTSGECVVYLKEKKQHGPKHSFVQAAIWRKLIDMLLGEPTKAFFDFQEGRFKAWLSDAKGDFYALRSIAAQALSDSYDSKKKVPAWEVNGKARENFITETAYALLSHRDQDDLEALKEDLDLIADKAFDLARAMACCRAGWICTMKHPDEATTDYSKMNGDNMEKYPVWDDQQDYSKTIDLRVAPMLLKYGNTKGQNVDICRVVKKAKVGMKPKKGTV